jgi:hypothetical protein
LSLTVNDVVSATMFPVGGQSVDGLSATDSDGEVWSATVTWTDALDVPPSTSVTLSVMTDT